MSHIVSSLSDEQDLPIIHPKITPIKIAKGLISTNFESPLSFLHSCRIHTSQDV